MYNEFSLSSVSVLDEYSNKVSNKVLDYINNFNSDRLLYNFKITAGFKDFLNVKQSYQGWENSRLGGHTMGHYLIALAQAQKHGYSDLVGKDKRTITQRLEYLINQLFECQNHYTKICSTRQNANPGFLFGAKLEDPQNPEIQFDRVESLDAKETWAPWYTMHKLLSGFVEVYKLTANYTSLKIAFNLGEWVFNRVVKWDKEIQKRVLSIEYGGMNDCLYELYNCAVQNKYKNAEHFLIAAHQFDEEWLFCDINKKDILDGRHANTTIPKFIGAVKRYLYVKDAKEYLKYAEDFWTLVVNHHTYVTGGNSECEFFGKDDELNSERSNTNCETCNTYNMLKLTKELFKITGKKKYADFYENTYINAILASVNDKTGMTTYFQPMATGCFKVYCNSNFEKNYFWCCSGTGLENFTKLGDSFYFYKESNLIVNMYQSSRVYWQEKDVTIIQECDLLKNDISKITVAIKNQIQKDFSIKFRIPDWSKDGVKVYLNGNLYNTEENTKDGYITISKQWNNQDSIEIKFNLQIQSIPLPDCDNVFAFKYGPFVLARKLKKNNPREIYQIGVTCDVCNSKIVGKEKLKLSGEYGKTTNLPVLDNEYFVVNDSVQNFIQNINSYMQKKEREEFILDNVESFSKAIFVPYYKLHNVRYGIYWYFKTK